MQAEDQIFHQFSLEEDFEVSQSGYEAPDLFFEPQNKPVMFPFMQEPNMCYTINPTVPSMGGSMPIEDPTAMKLQGFTEHTMNIMTQTYHDSTIAPTTF